MKAAVIYESLFGNTQRVALAVAAGLESRLEVHVFEVSSAPRSVDEYDLLVLGGPTHAFSMSHPSTREDGAADAGGHVISTGIGIREWIARTHHPKKNLMTATFDTRINNPRIPGSAAVAAKKKLRKLGYQVFDAESFWVAGSAGPLIEGELERAHRWGRFMAGMTAPTERYHPRAV